MRCVLLLSLAVLTQAKSREFRISDQESITAMDVASEDGATGVTYETATATASVDTDVKDLAALIKTDETKGKNGQLMSSLKTEVESHTAAIENKTKGLQLFSFEPKGGCSLEYKYRFFLPSYYESNCAQRLAFFGVAGGVELDENGLPYSIFDEWYQSGVLSRAWGRAKGARSYPAGSNDGVRRYATSGPVGTANIQLGRQVQLVPECRCEGSKTVCDSGGTCQFAGHTTCITEAFIDKWPGAIKLAKADRTLPDTVLIHRADKLQLVAPCKDGYECRQPGWRRQYADSLSVNFSNGFEPGLCYPEEK